MMKVNWVLSNSVGLDPTVPVERLKDVGSTWGGWKTWRSCQTDNVVCNDVTKARELITRNFQKQCNFYIPQSSFVMLDRPPDIKLYEGAFQHEVDDHDEIVAMHLASSVSDLVLLLGFSWGQEEKSTDRITQHKKHNYTSLVKQIIIDAPNTQWILIDHKNPLREEFANLPNLTVDSLEEVFNLL